MLQKTGRPQASYTTKLYMVDEYHREVYTLSISPFYRYSWDIAMCGSFESQMKDLESVDKPYINCFVGSDEPDNANDTNSKNFRLAYNPIRKKGGFDTPIKHGAHYLFLEENDIEKIYASSRDVHLKFLGAPLLTVCQEVCNGGGGYWDAGFTYYYKDIHILQSHQPEIAVATRLITEAKTIKDDAIHHWRYPAETRPVVVKHNDAFDVTGIISLPISACEVLLQQPNVENISAISSVPHC